MGETLDHLEKVIRDIPEGSFTVEPTNHIEKVIQEVGQEIEQKIEDLPTGSKLYQHNFVITQVGGVRMTFNIINSSDSSMNLSAVNDYLNTNGFNNLNKPYTASGSIYNGSGTIVGIVYSSGGPRAYYVASDGTYDNVTLSSISYEIIIEL